MSWRSTAKFPRVGCTNRPIRSAPYPRPHAGLRTSRSLRRRRARRRGSRRRRQPPRRPAGAAGHPHAEGRVQPPGPVRLLHRARRWAAPGGVRDAGAARAGAVDHHAGRPRSRRERGVGRRILCDRRQPVRLLHARDRDAPVGAPRQGHGRRRPPRGRAGPARAPVPLHRLAHDPRRLVGLRRAGRFDGGADGGPARRPAAPGPRGRQPARQHRGADAAAGRSRGPPRPRGLRRRHRPGRRTRRHSRRRRRLGSR